MTNKRANGGADPSPKKSKADVVDAALAVRCIDTVRVLSADMVEKAKSGHPGAPIGCAPIAYLYFGEYMTYSPANPKWSNRDRFVLSNGHACALQYSMLHLTGYDLPMDELKRFRQLGSMTPGHPENFLTPGVEVATGPLGQGISNSVGLAMAEKHLAAKFNRDGFDVVDHYTYVLCGDGCLQEGVASEACSLAGHLGLGKLIVCYDDNQITIDGNTNITFTEDVNKRFEAYGWHIQTVADVNDLPAMRAAIDAAKKETDRPSLIKVKTVIGHGSSKEGTHGVHGAPLGSDDMKGFKTKYGFDPAESFVVPGEVETYYRSQGSSGNAAKEAWDALFAAYSEKYPDLAAEYTRRMNNELPANWAEACAMPTYPVPDAKVVATRNRSEEMINIIADSMPEFVGGSADLTGSNLTKLKKSGDFQKDTPAGRYIRFGVREHGMAAVCNGMFAHGGLRPFCATFLNFIGYALGSVRLSALSRFGVIYVMTHDTIGQGEDGPTHQPIEMLEALRATPNMLTFRPADGNEVAGSYKIAMQRVHTPSVLCFSRQAAPTIAGSDSSKVALGAYKIAVQGANGHLPAIVLVATGTELTLAVGVADELMSQGVTASVVSMPCWELFEEQSQAYKLEVFPAGVPVMSIEAMGTHGWEKYAHAPFGLQTFGASAPAKDLFTHFGFTVPNLLTRAKEVIDFYKDVPGGAPSLIKRPTFPVIQPPHP